MKNQQGQVRPTRKSQSQTTFEQLVKSTRVRKVPNCSLQQHVFNKKAREIMAAVESRSVQEETVRKKNRNKKNSNRSSNSSDTNSSNHRSKNSSNKHSCRQWRQQQASRFKATTAPMRNQGINNFLTFSIDEDGKEAWLGF